MISRAGQNTNRTMLCIIAIACLPLTGFTTAPANFSGTYISVPSDAKNPGTSVTLKIAQTDNTIEIAHEESGKTTLSKFPLDGTDGTYTTPTGMTGRGFAKWHGKDLLLETVVASKPTTGVVIRLHQKERWQLSPDQKVLKIHIDTSSPDMPPDIMAAAIQPFTLTYKRTDQP